MEPKELRRAIWVGIFIALGLIILVTGILTLGSFQKSFVKSIRLESIFSDVGGLKKGNSIWFSGVKVGSISSIQFAGISKVIVMMNIEQSVQQYIHKDAGVKLSSDGLIGNKILEIGGGSSKSPMVEDGDRLQVINGVSTDEMMKNLETNNENLVSITHDFKKVSGQMAGGQGLLGSLVSDSGMVLQMKSILRNLELSSKETLELTKNANRFSSQLNNKSGLVYHLFADTSVFNELSRSVKDLNHISQGANTLIKSLNRTSEQLNSNKGALGLLLNDEKEAGELKSTLTNLHKSTLLLNEDLEAAQHNFLLRGFFKNKAKKNSQKTDSLPSNP